MNNSKEEREKTLSTCSTQRVDSLPCLHRPSLSVEMKKRKKKEKETRATMKVEFSRAAAAKWDFLPSHLHNPVAASQFFIPAAASCSAHQPAAQFLLNHRVVNRISAGQHHLLSPGGRRRMLMPPPHVCQRSTAAARAHLPHRKTNLSFIGLPGGI